MGWQIINGRPYFYETVYVNDERTKRCWTMCHAGLKASARVDQQQRERREDIAWIKATTARDRQIDQLVTTLSARVRKTVNAQLNQTGYHYLRGQWRKRHQSKMSAQSHLTELKDEILKRNEIETITPKECEELSGDIRRLALEALRGISSAPTSRVAVYEGEDDQPHVQIVFDIEEKVTEIEAKVKSMRVDFQYEDANSFDKLLIDQLTTAWVQWYVAGWLLDGDLVTNRTWRQNQYFAMRYQQCQGRLTRAVDQLTRIRQIPRKKLHIQTEADRQERTNEIEERRAKREAEANAALNREEQESQSVE